MHRPACWLVLPCTYTLAPQPCTDQAALLLPAQACTRGPSTWLLFGAQQLHLAPARPSHARQLTPTAPQLLPYTSTAPNHDCIKDTPSLQSAQSDSLHASDPCTSNLLMTHPQAWPTAWLPLSLAHALPHQSILTPGSPKSSCTWDMPIRHQPSYSRSLQP